MYEQSDAFLGNLKLLKAIVMFPVQTELPVTNLTNTANFSLLKFMTILFKYMTALNCPGVFVLGKLMSDKTFSGESQ